MPKYDYRCTACGHTYEKREGFDAPSLQACPACQAQARRVLTPPALVFKGSGWYKTDSRGAEPATAMSTSSTKTETKSESKADARSGTTAAESVAAD